MARTVRLAVSILSCGLLAGAFTNSGRVAATSPCRSWTPVPLTGTRLEVVREDGSVVLPSDPVVGSVPAVLCVEPTSTDGSAVTVKDCYEPELKAVFVLQRTQP